MTSHTGDDRATGGEAQGEIRSSNEESEMTSPFKTTFHHQDAKNAKSTHSPEQPQIHRGTESAQSQPPIAFRPQITQIDADNLLDAAVPRLAAEQSAI
jgi:hypothetical protein